MAAWICAATLTASIGMGAWWTALGCVICLTATIHDLTRLADDGKANITPRLIVGRAQTGAGDRNKPIRKK